MQTEDIEKLVRILIDNYKTNDNLKEKIYNLLEDNQEDECEFNTKCKCYQKEKEFIDELEEFLLDSWNWAFGEHESSGLSINQMEKRWKEKHPDKVLITKYSLDFIRTQVIYHYLTREN